MRLLPEKNAVLVAPKQPKRLAKLIPTSKLVRIDGKVVVAVPHRLDETRVLNNLGVKVPSPMLTKYTWPRSHKIANPFDAQKHTAGFLSLNPRAFVFNDLGTGKSLAALWAYHYLKEHGRCNKLLIVCPLSTMERTWADELFFNLPDMTYAILHGTKAKRLKALEQDVDVYIVNHHGAKVITAELAARSDIDVVIVDEVAQCARNKHDIWKALNQIINGKTQRSYVWGLTATPMPNEPTDAYWQVKLINPKRVKMYFTAFKRMVMQQINQFLWVPKDNALQYVDELMQPAIRFERHQCVDLPPTIYMTRTAELGTLQKKAYSEMLKTMQTQIEDGEITAANEAVKASKLVQIACGVAYTDDSHVELDPDARIKETLDLIKESHSKTIVFVPFRSAVSMVAQRIRDAGYTVGVIHGGVAKKDRDEIFGGFQNTDNNPEVIVAQPAAMSHGLTLVAASMIIWYAPVTSAETYEQANGRITRPGQKFTTLIANIEGTEVERRIYYRLANKQKMQNILLDKKLFDDAA